jgi:hypothetical protein
MKVLLIVIVNIVILSSWVEVSGQVNLDSGLVAFYPFNGNADDESGNDNHGTVMGAVLSSDRFGNDSTAYEFDGTSTYITIPSSPSLESPSTELSQVAWINIYSWSLVGTQFGPILMKSNSGANAFQYRLSVGTIGVNTAINNWLNAVTISDTINFNEWYMITSTLKDDTVRSYVNGIFIGEGTLTGPITADNRPLEIGRDVPGVTEIFNGKIDDVRIYDRALTDAEIQELFEITTDLKKIKPIKLNQYQLSQNYPNPFNPSTTIEFDLPKTSNVTLKILNILGEEVAKLVSDNLSAGSYSYEWNASNLASGVYLYRLQVGDYVVMRKMILNR